MKKQTIKILTLITLAIFATGFALPINSAFNEQINYQGKLTNSVGVAVADGYYCMKFVIYDDLTAGSVLWSEEWKTDDAHKVHAVNGLFSVMLGSQASISSVDFNSASRYLEVQLDPGCDDVYEEVFAPRKQFGSVPSAFEAKQLGGYTWASPGAIGSTTPNTGAFTTLNVSTATLGYLSLTSPLGVAYGGTGQSWSSVVTGSMPYFSGTGTLSTISAATSGYVWTSGGVNTAPSWQATAGGSVTGTGSAGYNAYWTSGSALGAEEFVALSRGGTNANLTASNGGIVYSTASALSVLPATGTANAILMSGASGAPSWSLATYPSTAGASGTILTSNGTNFVNTTTMWPATISAGEILYATAENTIGSTSTFTFDDTNGLQVLGSGPSEILSGNGSIIFGGTGNTNNENLLFDFETVADQVGISSSTGVATLNFNALNLTTTGTGTFGAFNMATGASSGYVFTSDASGNASWTNLDLAGTYVPYTGATTDVNLGTHNIVSSGTARFDGNIGIGRDPISSYGISISKTGDTGGFYYYNESGGSTFGGGTIISNYSVITADYSIDTGISNNLTATGSSDELYGISNRLTSSGEYTNQWLAGIYNTISPHGPGVTAYGMITYGTTSTIDNPTSDQIGLYMNWSTPGTDANMKRWAIYNASSNATAGKVFLGLDNTKTYWGTGYDASIYYNGTDLIIDPKVVGTGAVNLNGGNLTTTGTGSFGYVTIGSALPENTFSTASQGSSSTLMYIGNSTIDVTGPSDIKTKENIATTQYGIVDLMSLTVRDFKYKKEYVDEGPQQKEHTGMVAQEVQEVFPEAIIERSDGLIAINYTKLIPLIIKSMQDIQYQISLGSRTFDFSDIGTLEGGDILNGKNSSFTNLIQTSLASLGASIADGVATFKVVVADTFRAKTADVKRIQMTDEDTSEIYCVWMKNGELQKEKGECSVVAPLPVEVIEITPATNTEDYIPEVTVEPIIPEQIEQPDEQNQQVQEAIQEAKEAAEQAKKSAEQAKESAQQAKDSGKQDKEEIVVALNVSSVAPISDINVVYGTDLSSAGLPAQVTATLSDATTQLVQVAWDVGTPAYNANSAGIYVFSGNIVPPTDATNTNNIKASVNIIVAPEPEPELEPVPEPEPEPEPEPLPSIGDIVQEATSSLFNAIWRILQWAMQASLQGALQLINK